MLLGADHVAKMLGPEVMDNKTHCLTSCCFANVSLPLTFAPWNPSRDRETLDETYIMTRAEDGKVDYKTDNFRIRHHDPNRVSCCSNVCLMYRKNLPRGE